MKRSIALVIRDFSKALDGLADRLDPNAFSKHFDLSPEEALSALEAAQAKKDALRSGGRGNGGHAL